VIHSTAQLITDVDVMSLSVSPSDLTFSADNASTRNFLLECRFVFLDFNHDIMNIHELRAYRQTGERSL